MAIEFAKYIGKTVIKAKPMTRGEYNAYRGYTAPENDDPYKDGYLVVHVDEDGNNYESFCWKDVFERTYQSLDVGISLDGALHLLKMGFKVARKGWNGKGMWLIMCDSGNYEVGREDACDYDRLPWIGMKTADDKFVPWVVSQTDLLADDWMVVG